MLSRKLKVFLCYSSYDKAIVDELRNRLRDEGWIDPWQNDEKILVGEDWQAKIKEAIETSDSVIICLSRNSTQKDGFVQKELRYSIDVAKEKPLGSNFLMPMRIEECAVPEEIRGIQWKNYFGREKENTYRNLLASLLIRNKQIEAQNKTIPKHITASTHFIGRKYELERISSIIENPHPQKRIIYVEGPGGIGKTHIISKLLRSMLDQGKPYTIPFTTLGEEKFPRLIDFYSTDNRTADGLRERIIQYLDPNNEHFVEYYQPNNNSQAVFRKCLQRLVNKSSIILTFDTFELIHGEPLANWLFDDSEIGIQMPGLVCLIGSRPLDEENASIVESLLKKNDLVDKVQLQGFSSEEALEFYCAFSQLSPEELNASTRNFVLGIGEKSLGKPFVLELFFDQLGEQDLSDRNIDISNITLGELEKVIADFMAQRHVTFGFIDSQRRSLDIATFNTLLCMSYLIKRFDNEILLWIINQGFIRLDDKPNEIEKVQDILDTLSQFFFIKVYEDGSIKLHDEMVRIVRNHLFWFLDNDISRRRSREFQKAIPILYDELIRSEQTMASVLPSGSDKLASQSRIAQLRAERLYYMLEYGRTLQQELKSIEGVEQAYGYFLELKDIHDEQLLRHLPREVLRVIQDFPTERQQDIFSDLAEIQQRLKNPSQAE